MQRLDRVIRTSLTVCTALTIVGGCGNERFERRFSRKMKVLEHDRQKNLALGERWADEDWVDANGDVIRAGTGARYRLPKQLRVKLKRDEWPSFPTCVPDRDVVAVYVGSMPKEGDRKPGEEEPLVYCYILAEQLVEDHNRAALGGAAPDDEQDGGLGLHARVREAWEQAYSEFNPTQVTQPISGEYGQQRRFDTVHHDQPGEDAMHLYLFPSSIDASTTHQIAVYYHIEQGAAQQQQLLTAVDYSLETISIAPSVPVASGTDAPVIP